MLKVGTLQEPGPGEGLCFHPHLWRNLWVPHISCAAVAWTVRNARSTKTAWICGIRGPTIQNHDVHVAILCATFCSFRVCKNIYCLLWNFVVKLDLIAVLMWRCATSFAAAFFASFFSSTVSFWFADVAEWWTTWHCGTQLQICNQKTFAGRFNFVIEIHNHCKVL